MEQFPCRSCLVVSCRAGSAGKEIISVNIQHACPHKTYFDVALPPEAYDIICETLDWNMPGSIAPKIREMFPQVTTAQVHATWTAMSKVLWRRNDNQMESAKQLLEELRDEVDLLNLQVMEGVEQLAFGLKLINNKLKKLGNIQEIRMDATCTFSLQYCRERLKLVQI
jgi:hypothetical protein